MKGNVAADSVKGAVKGAVKGVRRRGYVESRGQWLTVVDGGGHITMNVTKRDTGNANENRG